MARSRALLALIACVAGVLLGGCGGSSAGGTASCGITCSGTYTASVSASSLTFSTNAGIASATQTVTLTNTGTLPLTISGVALGGTNAALFSLSNGCGASLAVGANCAATVGFGTAGSGSFAGTLTFGDNASAGSQVVTLMATGLGGPKTGLLPDCTVANTGCTTTSLQGDPIAPGGFHGEADVSLRKDPNSTMLYLAYSWPHTLADGTHVVDLHLASSSNGGTTYTYVGPLYQSTVSTQTGSAAYSSVNDSSTETISILPIALTGASAGQTLWVQAHQAYLVKPQAGIYDQLNATSVVSITAVQLATPAGASAGTSLLALGAASTPEARLGTSVTDTTRNATQNVASLTTTASKCGNWGQPALWYQGGLLYVALECSEVTGTGTLDANELAHYVYSTTPTGADASKWVWSYVGMLATQAQAAKLGTVEGTSYSFFTEPEFDLTTTGQLVMMMSPSIFSPAGSQQPVIQYGCRMIPVTLTPTAVSLDIDSTTSAPVVIAKVTTSDLYTGVNEGPGACTYEPASNNGILIERKFENDPVYGFYIFPVNSLIKP